MRSDHFENLTPVRKVVDLFPPLFLYLDNEIFYGYHVIDFFTPYDERKNLRYDLT